MARIGDMYLGGKDSGIPESETYLSGIAFLLKDNSEIDFIWRSQDSNWQVELKKNHAYVISKSSSLQVYDNLVTRGLEQIQRCLDIIAVKKLGSLYIDHPETNHIALFMRNEKFVLKHFSTTKLGVESTVSVEVRDKNGNIKPSPPIPEPPWIWAFRYYRLSQASQDIFEAYRDLFLSLEALLNIIRPKQPREREVTWLRNALQIIAAKISFSEYMPATIGNPIDYFMQTQYINIRCRLFHAKFPDALLPHEELNPTDVLDAYGILIRLWRDIGEAYFRIPRGGSVFTNQGFKMTMDGVFQSPLSIHFTEDNSLPNENDTEISPLGLPTYEFEESKYLSETKPGIVSWQGQIKVLDIHKSLSIHRICSLVNKNVINVDFIKNGLSPSGTDIFETYQSIRLINRSQPKIIF